MKKFSLAGCGRFLVGIATIVSCVAAVIAIPQAQHLIEPYVAQALLSLTQISATSVKEPPTPTQIPVRKVTADSDWQATGVNVKRGQTVLVQVISGVWSYVQGNSRLNSGEGTGYICSQVYPESACVELIPGFPSDALIARIGTRLYPIGNGATVTSTSDGDLELRMNDSPTGLSDNHGSLTVQIKFVN